MHYVLFALGDVGEHLAACYNDGTSGERLEEASEEFERRESFTNRLAKTDALMWRFQRDIPSAIFALMNLPEGPENAGFTTKDFLCVLVASNI